MLLNILFHYVIDIDECITEIDDCDVNAECLNTAGGHNCSCHKGFQGNGTFCC